MNNYKKHDKIKIGDGMSKTDEIIKKIALEDFSNQLSTLDSSDPNFQEKCNKMITDYSMKLINILEKEGIEIAVAVLDMLANSAPSLAMQVISSENEKIMRAQLVLENIKGYSATQIRNDLKAVKTYKGLLMIKSFFSAKGTTEYENKICEVLSKYLNTKNDSEVENMVDNDTIEFFTNLQEVDEIIFSLANMDATLDRTEFIKKLFTLKNMDSKTLSKIYKEVLLKNKYLDNFDYTDIIVEDISLLSSVEGLIRKCSEDLLDALADDETYENETDYKEMIERFREIVKLNEKDENSIKIFLNEIIKRKEQCPKLMSLLEKEDFYQKYKIGNIELEYEAAIHKLLSGDKEIEEYLIGGLGKNKVFQDNFEQLIDCFAKSENEEYQRLLITPLAIALAEIQKEKYDLDFEVKIISSSIETGTLGYYSKEDNVLFLNTYYIKNADNIKSELAETINTIFHEVTHAKQYREVESSTDLNYDNLLIAIDLYNMNQEFSDYYGTNYQHISMERDARACAYVETKTLLQNYPELTENLEPESITKYILSDYIRKENFFGTRSYYGIITRFENYINCELKANQSINDIESIKKIEELIEKYPVILQFYDYDKINCELKRKPDEYFENKLKELESLPNSIDKTTQIYSIKAFRYAIKVGEYMNTLDISDSKDDSDEYSDDIIKEVINNVGSRPNRK